MATITRGTIKSYDAANHRAAVQLAGSLAVWVESLPVSTAIDPVDVVAGRECGVLFFTDGDPDDAAVITVHNALPAGHTRLADRDGDTRVEVEASPDEDKIRLTTLGTLRVLIQDVTPHVDVTGDLRLGAGSLVITNQASGALASPILINVVRTDAAAIDGIDNRVNYSASSTANALRGVTGQAVIQAGNATTISYVRGLEFRAQHLGSGTVTDLLGAQMTAQGGGPATNREGARILVQDLIASATLQAAVRGIVNGTVTLTAPAVYGFKSEITMSRTTVTDFSHFHVTDAQLILGAAITNNYGFRNPGMVFGTNRRPFWDAGVAGAAGDNHGNRFRSNTAFGTVLVAGLFGGGDGVVHIHDAAVNPAVPPVAGHILYNDAATGNLYALGPAGTLTLLAVP
jgi:hypothetical protein